MAVRTYGPLVVMVLVGVLTGACGGVVIPAPDSRPLALTPSHTRASPTAAVPSATYPSDLPTPFSPTPTLSPAAPSATPTITTSAATTVPQAVCPVGAGLRKDTTELQLAYRLPGRLYMTGSAGMGGEYFSQLEVGLRVLVGASLSRLQELSQRAEEEGVPYEALAYSLEAGRNTPIEEQRDLVGATRQAAQLAHEHGKLLIMGPGFKLMEANWADYPNMAAYADLWVIQSQRLQVDPPGPAYRREIEKTINQIRAGNPTVSIWVQISVTPGARILSAEEVLSYRESIADLVDGVYIYDSGDPSRPETLRAIFAAVCGHE